MKKSIQCSLNTMNYLFLREVFNKNQDSDIRDIVLQELSLFLKALSKEEWTKEFKEITKTELSEGDYLEELNANEAERLINKAIKDICYEEDPKLLSKYIEIVEEIKENR